MNVPKQSSASLIFRKQDSILERFPKNTRHFGAACGKPARHVEARDEVTDWLTFYNHRRLHSTLGYVSPMRFEGKWLADQVRQAA